MILHVKNKLIPNYQHISLTISDKLNLTCPLEKKTVIWDPLQQFPNYITNIKCKVCDKDTHFLRWIMAMIVIPVYVGITYKFTHETLGVDANILQKLPIEKSPFVLFHKTGVSINLYAFYLHQ